MKKLLILALSVTLCSCSNKQVGMGTGAAVGTTLGGLVSNSFGGALIGGAAGTIAGGLIGNSLDEKDEEKIKEESQETLDKVNANEKLTIADIKVLSKSGISDEIIIAKINKSNSIFNLNTSEIIDLKDSGVSEEVIKNMIS